MSPVPIIKTLFSVGFRLNWTEAATRILGLSHGILRYEGDKAPVFCLDNFHFHWGDSTEKGSEHAINGKQ